MSFGKHSRTQRLVERALAAEYIQNGLKPHAFLIQDTAMRVTIGRAPVLLALVFLVGVPRARAESRHPNVVVIVLDDLGWADFGCQGSELRNTPNIDRLARESVRFTNAYAACPVCSPSRAAILTGKYPARLNLTDWLPGRPDRDDQKLLRPMIRQQLPLPEVTPAEALKQANYASAHIGKWHLGSASYWPEHQGFDVNIGGTATGSPPGGYFGFRTPNLQAKDANEYLTDRLTDEAIGFMTAHKREPFFIYLAHYAVHIPLGARPVILARVQADARNHVPGQNALYEAMIESVDEGIGRVMKALEDLGLADSTLLILTSDNGGLSVKEGPNTPATTNAPLRAGKGYLYEGGIRVPLIMRLPGKKRAGTELDVPVSGQDLYPTILAACGVSTIPGQVIDGENLMPILEGTGGLAQRSLFWHYPHYSNQGGKPGGAIRSADLKLIEWYEDSSVELYDVKHDVSETRNLAHERPREARRLRDELARWRESVHAQMPRPNPRYRARQE